MPVPLQELRFRPFEVSDAGVLDRWLRRVGLGVPRGLLEGEWTRRLLGDGRIYMRLAVDAAGRTLGFVRLDIAPDRTAEITLIADPDRLRRGIGTSLLEHALAEMRTRGLGRMLAVVDIDNRAGREFFLAAGFEIARSPLPGFDHLERVVHRADRQPPLEIVP
jgi:ribosomal protein S18 acetylase RimI-like enzyme